MSDNDYSDADAHEVAAFIAAGLVSFQQAVRAKDPAFFQNEVNLVVYRELATNLATMWVQHHRAITQMLAGLDSPVAQ